MKLSEYIFMCLNDKLNTGDAYTITKDEIELWIVEWYKSEFQSNSQSKLPPMWLADWKKVWRKVWKL